MQARSHKSRPFRLHPLSLLVLSLLATGAVATEPTDTAAATATVAEVQFNEGFIRTAGQPIDLRRFSKGNIVQAGQYRADVYVNTNWIGRIEVNLRLRGVASDSAQPCFDRTLLERAGVDLDRLTPTAQAMLAQQARCTLLPELVADATATFDPNEQRLNISMPQIAMRHSARGYVDPQFWDEGITAARLGYNANVYHSNNASGRDITQAYLGLNAGINVGAWRLRHIGSYSHDDQAGSRYQSVQTSLQRSITPIKSQLVIGDAYTDGAMFDSVGFRGVQLASDERMRPESQRGYAPVVRGIANSNARIQIRQGGNILYETTVAPGAFEINDLYPTGYGGDLDVTVTEANGSTHTFKVPFAAPVNSVRAGVTRYSATAGQYRNPALHDSPWLAQGTVQHGFTNLLTGYGGATLTEGYAAAVGGIALNTDYGAFGADLTYARTALDNQPSQQGLSMRLSYSKLIDATHTNIALGAYRYSSEGYLGLQDAMQTRDADRFGAGNALDTVPRTRGRLQLTLNQPLPESYGNFYASASTQDYWNRPGRDTQFQAGYINQYKRVSYGISAGRQYEPLSGKWDNRIMFTVGIPLGSDAYAPNSLTMVQKDSSGATQVQETLNGTFGQDNAFNYGLSASRSGGSDTGNTTASANANVNYTSPAAQLGASLGKGQGYTQAGLSASGGLVAYAGGVAFTPAMGETMAIVEAPDAAGARIANGSGLRVDPRGHAVVANLTPFSRNQIEIDPKGLPLNVELGTTSQQAAPTAGAVVKVGFKTENLGRAAVLRLSTPEGQPLPFGAEVFNAEGASIGTVAQGGRVIVHGLKADSGQFRVQWGEAADQGCLADYQLPPADTAEATSLSAIAAVCRPASGLTTASRATGKTREQTP